MRAVCRSQEHVTFMVSPINDISLSHGTCTHIRIRALRHASWSTSFMGNKMHCVLSISRKLSDTSSTSSSRAHLISDLPLVELKVQLRFLSHCNQTPFVQRSASVWQKILRAAWLIEIRCFLFFFDCCGLCSFPTEPTSLSSFTVLP